MNIEDTYVGLRVLTPRGAGTVFYVDYTGGDANDCVGIAHDDWFEGHNGGSWSEVNREKIPLSSKSCWFYTPYDIDQVNILNTYPIFN